LTIDTGQLIAGHYRLLERIGTGAMGVVWRARDERLQRMVAVKQLLLQPGLGAAEEEEVGRRAMREARIAARLQHPNAIAVFDVAEYEGAPCLVMEYLASRSLAAVISERGSLPPREAAAIGSQVASALAAAHRAGIVHRDIKPGNILVNDAGVAKITDFGISRAVGDATVTQTGMVAGTPAYLAPEVAKGQDSTSLTDVFSLGATLYHAVEGAPPFGLNPNPLALLHAVAVGEVPPPKQAGPLTDLLMSLLRTEPDERPSMERVAKDLADVAAGNYAAIPLPPVPVAATRTRRVPKTPPTDRREAAAQTPTMLGFEAVPGDPPPDAGRRRKVMAAAAAVVILVLGGLAVLALNWPNSGKPAAQPSSSTPPSNTRSQTPTSSGTPTTQNPVAAGASTDGTAIDWSSAGNLLVQYYDYSGDSTALWGLLTPNAQNAYFNGSQQNFQQYWSQYSQVTPGHSLHEITNANQSLNMNIIVTFTTANGGSQQVTKHVVVVRQNGKLLIDSDPR
jgi:serine/threonine protein kinase